MLFVYYFSKPVSWILPWLLQAFIYYRLLGKLGLNKKSAFVPFMAEGQFSRIYFKNRRFYFHALILTGIFLGSGFYLRWFAHEGIAKLVGTLFILAALLIYGCFLIVLYWKIARSFGKGIIYCLATIVLPMVFLFLLTLKKAQFKGSPVFRIHRFIRRPLRIAYNVVREIAFAGEVLVLAAGVLFLTVRMYMPRPLVEMLKYDTINKVRNIHGDGKIIDREASMGSEYSKLNTTYAASREKYFPDHAKDKSVVVLEYIVGSDLEDKAALASVNIDQIIKATKGGSSLKFVVEAGGTQRWFTSGIDDYSHARYEIQDGKLSKVQDLDATASMSDPDALYDFLVWARNNYQADRYMLVLWDHGGGLSSGFGKDALNKRESTAYGTLLVNEIADAIGRSGMRFDLIGFDACLMQGVELAKALEPYADYYLASEETEEGYGWFYTSAFELLAKNPGIATEAFGKEMISSFDVYNSVLNSGKAKTNTTLSLIDLSRLDQAYEQLMAFYDLQDEAIRKDPADYVDISAAASKSYAFLGNEQLDLIDYLEKLDDADYDDSIISSKQIKELTDRFKATVVYRNQVSNEGIYGIALTFPFDSISVYQDEHNQYKAFNMEQARNFYDDYFSIMAYKKKEQDENKENKTPFEELFSHDYTTEDWYVAGFEDYADAPLIIDIPLLSKENGYQLQLTDEVWKIIIDAREIFYQKSDDGWRYLGNDVPGAYDENDHPLVSCDGYMVHINNQLVAYEATDIIENEDSTIYRGTVEALLNNETKIILQIEWDPVTAQTGENVQGHVLGYVLADNDAAHMEKGFEQLSPGQRLDFLFDYYDDQGKLIKSEPYGGMVIVTSQESLKVKDQPLDECDLKYGIVLTDAYQRTFASDLVETHISAH